MIKDILSNKNIFIPGLILFCMVSFTGTVFSAEMARTTMVEVMGAGTIRHEDDAAKARERAISASLISAVEKVLINLLPVESLVANFKTINDILYSNAGSIVQGYKVLTEEKYGNFYRVMVQATVSVNKVLQSLSNAGIVVDQKTMPSILFLISEQNLEDIAIQYWWDNQMSQKSIATETAVSETLQKKGFAVINHKKMDIKKSSEESLFYGSSLDNEGAIDLGLRYQADVVIVGTSKASQASNTMGTDIKSFMATVSLNVFRTDTGSKIGATEHNAVTVNIDEIAGGKEALTRAGILAGEELAPRIMDAWRKEDKKPSEIKVRVEGTNYMTHFVTLRKNLINLPGVKDIQTREMEADKAVIIINFQGKGKDLANALILNTFDTFGVNIAEVTDEYLKMEIIPVNKLKH